MTTTTNPELFHILALKQAVKLEGLGLKRRGRSATMIAKVRYGLGRNAPREQVMQKILAEIESWKA